jgi:peptidyl-prolyl cis-trans isomerase C
MTPLNQWLHLARIPLVCVLLSFDLTTGTSHAQPASSSDPSPFAPGDLKRPIFDTQTPIYDTSPGQAKSPSAVVAEIDGRAITLGDVGDAIAELPITVKNLPFADLYPGILAQLISQQALVIRAQRQALDEDPAVRRKVKAASDRIMANALLEQEISRSITESALLSRYDKDIAGKPGPEEVHVRVIMLPTEKGAVDIIAELRGGADFAAIAKRSSKDTTAPAGGDAGFVALEGLTAEVGAVVFSLQPGQIAPYPVRSVGAWFVLKVEERRRQPARPFSVMRDSLRQAMLGEGVADVLRAAMTDVTVREYDFTGKETDASSAGGGSRSPK